MTKAEVIQFIGKINDPSTQKPLSESGTITELIVSEDNKIHITFGFERAQNQQFVAFQRELIRVLKNDLKFDGVKIDYKEPDEKVMPSGRFIAVASGKGGVGKSTTTIELAYAFARAGKKVAIIDADVYGSSVAQIMGITKNPPQAINRKILPFIKDGIQVMGCDLLLAGNDPVLWRGPMLGKMIQQFFTDVAWDRDIDVFLLDMPPGTGDVALDVQMMIPQCEMLIVTTPQKDAAYIANKAGLAALNLGHQIIGAVENMSYLTCAHCGERTYLFGQDGGQAVADQLQTELLAQVPMKTANNKEEIDATFDEIVKKISF